MIYYRMGADRWVLTTQTDHAFFSGEVLSLWREDGLPQHPRRGDLLFAAREHDNGWREADAAPRVRPDDGLPHDFLSIPEELRFEIWRRGVERFATERPYAALLIAWHARELHQRHRGEARWQDFLEGLDSTCDALLATSGADPRDVARDYRLLELVDLLSLAVCSRWEQSFALHGYTFRCAEDTLYLEPLPLAGATTFVIRCRTIQNRRYAGDQDLGVALAAARWQQRRVRVV